jgi:DNA mismatch repair protein MutL
MARIHVLDPLVVNQIAAGEVIERPASVVKELVENALDAGARRVAVRVVEGGRALVEVSDDGCGMDAEDLALAFLPHATSKVRTAEDLQHVASLGFRGEALASVGSVARVRIVSRVAGAEGGHAVEDLDGEIGPVEPAAASTGTVVRVEGMFGRVPARRKFLRAPGTELGHVVQQMGRFAVAFPEVAFRLEEGSRVLLDAPVAPSRTERIAVVAGDDVARALVPARREAGDLSLEAWVGPPSLHRADGRFEQTFLNGRFLHDRTVAHAVREAYRGLLPPGGRRPVAFLFLSAPPETVDVNVHPAKAEVRWRDSQAVHRLVLQALRARLEVEAPGVRVPLETVRIGGATLAPAPPSLFTTSPARAAAPAAQVAPSWAARPAEAPAAAGLLEEEPVAPATPRRATALRPVGQALGTYLVLEGDDEVVLVDQHALHERVLVDRISARLREAGRLEVQPLLVPLVVRLDPADTAAVVEAADLLQTLGWRVEAFGASDVAVTAVPAVLRRPDPEAAFRDVLRLLASGAGRVDRTVLLDDAIHRMACRAAVMAGDPLHPDEVVALLEQAEGLEHAHTCPHGRPTRLVLSRADLERWFHRSV